MGVGRNLGKWRCVLTLDCLLHRIWSLLAKGLKLTVCHANGDGVWHYSSCRLYPSQRDRQHEVTGHYHLGVHKDHT
ncbi:hypothetical protein FGO68_gene1621 [Halteria grandinella]|uniref:Secreted protein n=1 Tax=Halteria grandinella TaxID=5974 RepID=A0A8J8SUC2_HALGN|nr:hypothetical protein FGO68_gene1621 [Halteria grandinella]